MKEIDGYNGRYLAGEDGHIYTTINTRGNPLPSPRRLAERIQPRWGYVVVQLRWRERNLNRLVHTLIAIAFLGPRNGLEVNHVDGNKQNNLPGNLEYVTHKENIRHSWSLGLHKNHARGERIGNSRLTAEQIPSIRSALNAGEPKLRIANRYGVSFHAIACIANGETWKHVL